MEQKSDALMVGLCSRKMSCLRPQKAGGQGICHQKKGRWFSRHLPFAQSESIIVNHSVNTLNNTLATWFPRYPFCHIFRNCFSFCKALRHLRAQKAFNELITFNIFNEVLITISKCLVILNKNLHHFINIIREIDIFPHLSHLLLDGFPEKMLGAASRRRIFSGETAM